MEEDNKTNEEVEKNETVDNTNDKEMQEMKGGVVPAWFAYEVSSMIVGGSWEAIEYLWGVYKGDYEFNGSDFAHDISTGILVGGITGPIGSKLGKFIQTLPF